MPREQGACYALLVTLKALRLIVASKSLRVSGSQHDIRPRCVEMVNSTQRGR